MLPSSKIALVVVQTLLRIILGILVSFWLIVLGYSVARFISGGLPAVQQLLLQDALSFSELFAKSPRWDLVAMRFGVLALLTVVFWLADRGITKRIANHRGPDHL
jgi:hypothetical protein